MATTAQIEDLAALYAGYFNRAPDPAGLQFWIDQIDNGREFNTIAADFAASPEAEALYPFLTTPGVSSSAVFVTEIYANLFGRTPDQEGLDFWTGVLEAGTVSVADFIEEIILGAVDAPDATPPTFDKTTLDNKVEVGLDWADETSNVPGFEFGAVAAAAAVSALAGVTSDAATVVAAKAATDAFVSGGGAIPGETFALTAGLDAPTGTTGNDVFIGLVSATQDNTLTVGDEIDGGQGADDELRITIDDDPVNLAIASISNVENVFFRRATESTDDINIAGNDFNKATVDFIGLEHSSSFDIDNINTDTVLTLQNGDLDGSSIDVFYSELPSTTPINAVINLTNIDDLDLDPEFDDSGDGTSDNDSVTINLDGVQNTGGDMDIDGDDQGIENWTFNVLSASELEDLELDDSNTGEIEGQTINFVVNGDLTIDTLTSYSGINGDQVVNIEANANVTIGSTDFLDADAGETFNLNITGAGNVTIDDLDDTSGTDTEHNVNAGTATGNISLADVASIFDSVTTGSGDDLVGINDDETAVSLGDGDDILVVSSGNLSADSSFDGGAGENDIINLQDGADLTNATAGNVTGFETLDVSGGIGTYDLSLKSFAAAQIDEALAGALAGAVTLTNAPADFQLDVKSEADDGDFALGFAQTIELEDASGSSDQVTLNAEINDGDDDGAADGDITFTTSTTIADVENITVDSTVETIDDGVDAGDYTTTFDDLIADSVETLTITGDSSVDFTALTNTGNTLTSVNASGSTGAVDLDVSAITTQVGYQGSAGVDTYAGTDGGSIVGNEGNDQITLVAGGTNADTIIYRSASDVTLADDDEDGSIDAFDAESIANFLTTASAGGSQSDLIDVTTFDFSGFQASAVNKGALANSLDGGAFDTQIGDFFADAGGDRGVAFGTNGGNTYVFVDANGDGDFGAADDLAIEITGVTDFTVNDLVF